MPRILLIDDDDAVRLVLRTSLELMGHSVAVASNGREGLEVAMAEKFDLVITDLIMPEKEGIETIQDLHRRQPSLKIIAMSGGGRGNAADYLPLAGLLGANRTLAKPFSHEELEQAVGEVLGSK